MLIFQEKIDQLGDTPIKESKLFEVIQTCGNDKSKIALALLTRDEIINASASEVKDFIDAVVLRVTGFEDSEGVLKSTPNIEAIKFPNFFQAEELRNAILEQAKVLEPAGKILNGDKVSPEEMKRVADDMESASRVINSLIWEIAGLDEASLSEWERQLVVHTITRSVTDIFGTKKGKPQGS